MIKTLCSLALGAALACASTPQSKFNTNPSYIPKLIYQGEIEMEIVEESFLGSKRCTNFGKDCGDPRYWSDFKARTLYVQLPNARLEFVDE